MEKEAAEIIIRYHNTNIVISIIFIVSILLRLLYRYITKLSTSKIKVRKVHCINCKYVRQSNKGYFYRSCSKGIFKDTMLENSNVCKYFKYREI